MFRYGTALHRSVGYVEGSASVDVLREPHPGRRRTRVRGWRTCIGRKIRRSGRGLRRGGRSGRRATEFLVCTIREPAFGWLSVQGVASRPLRRILAQTIAIVHGCALNILASRGISMTELGGYFWHLVTVTGMEPVIVSWYLLRSSSLLLQTRSSLGSF